MVIDVIIASEKAARAALPPVPSSVAVQRAVVRQIVSGLATQLFRRPGLAAPCTILILREVPAATLHVQSRTLSNGRCFPT
jgi:hypothetical protein